MAKFSKLDVPHQWKDEFTKYPHGYSIFEAISKWVDQINKMVTNINQWNEYLGGFTSTFGEVPQQMVELRQEMTILLDNVNSDLTTITDEVTGLTNTLLSHLANYTSYLNSELGEEHIIRTLHNGVKDEVDLGIGKLIKRVSDEVVLDGSENWSFNSADDNRTTVLVAMSATETNRKTPINAIGTDKNGFNYSSLIPYATAGRITATSGYIYIALPIANGNLQDCLNYLNQYPITLTYQLAEPELIDLPEVMSPNTREIVRLSEQVDKLINLL